MKLIDRRLLREARQTPLAFTVTLLLGLAGGMLIVLQAATLSEIVARVYLGGDSLQAVRPSLGFLLLIFVLRAAVLWGGEISAGRLAQRVKADLRQRLVEHMVRLGPMYLRGERTGELINTLTEGIAALDDWFRAYLPQLVLAALVPLTFLCFVFPRDLLSGLVLLLTAPLIPVFMILIGNLADALTKRQWKSLSRMSAHFLDVLQGLTTLKILGRSRAQIQVIQQVSARHRDATLRVLRVAFLSALALELIATLSTAVVAVEIGLRLLYGRMSFPEAFFVLLLAPEFYLPLRLLGTRFHAGVAGVAAAERIFAVLDIQPKTENRRPATSVSRPPSSVRFSNVHYTYPDGRVALRDVSFTIEPGERVALIGPSGAGKSTIAHLLLGFMQPTEGRITLQPPPSPTGSGRGCEAEEGEGKVAWLPQHPYLFNDTLAANIRLARPDASLDDVIAAAKAAHAHEFIEKLGHRFTRINTDKNHKNIRVHPRSSASNSDETGTGYDTFIGERGARLSGGQAQRIALARAFLLDAPLIVLDEPTAHLDPSLEAQLQQSTDVLLEGRSALIIAHRLHTVTRADKIILLDDGQIIAQGTHSELFESNPRYSKMVSNLPVESNKLQVAGYGLKDNFPTFQPATSNFQPSTFNLRPATAPRPSTFNLQPATFLRGSWPQIALSVLLSFATIGSSIGLLGTSAYIISAAALQPSIAVLQVPIVGVRFFGIARGLFRYLERLVSHRLTFDILARLRVWFYECIEPLAPARLQMARSGDLLSRIISDIGSLENFYTRALAPPLTALCVAFLAGGLLARYDWGLALALWIFLALAGMLLPVLIHALSRGVGREQAAVGAALKAALLDALQGLPDLLAFGRAGDHLRIVKGLGEKLIQLERRAAQIAGLRAALMNLLTNLGMAAVLLGGIRLVNTGQLEGVYLAALTLVAFASFEAVMPLPEAAQYLAESLAAVRRLFEIVSTPSEVHDPPNPRPAPQNFALEVHNLSFDYPQPPTFNLQPSTLQNISFSLPYSKSLAILGPSGAGKSTIFNLLLRFWEYHEGQITLGGYDLREYAQEDVRACFGVVSQRTHLFNASLRENLLIARPDASDAEVTRAIEQAQLVAFVESLPQGYETQIGEQGLKLSGGERQRLALARALLRDAPILLLDEPTTHLDPLTGRAFMRTLRASRAGHSLILITHDPADLDWVDEMLYLRDGKIDIRQGR